MDLRQLEYFQIVGRLNSITKAAEQFHIAQPSVTVAIQKLEEELGVKLLDRSQRQITLTIEGKIFLQRVDDILNRLQDSIREMNDYRLLYKGSIKIGITPIIGAFIFPNVFARFRERYPDFKLTFVEEGSLSIRRQLEQGKLDIGILIISNISSRLATLPITTGQIHVCLSSRHPLGSFSRIPFTELREYPFVLFKEDTYMRQIILEECAKNQFEPNIIFSSRQIETILGLVEQGVGIAFLLDAIVKKHAAILSRPLVNPLLIQAGVAWNKDRYLSNAAKAFIDFAAEQYSASRSSL
ncbi:MAG: LysR family transcriptional regulator [Veillonellales bacterium]